MRGETGIGAGGGVGGAVGLDVGDLGAGEGEEEKLRGLVRDTNDIRVRALCVRTMVVPTNSPMKATKSRTVSVRDVVTLPGRGGWVGLDRGRGNRLDEGGIRS